MKANEITLAVLKASKVVSLENGNVVEYIKASTYNKDAYNKAIARGEDIVLFKTSESDNKARAIVSVNGVVSTYPLYINEVKKFAETGNCPAEKLNYFVAGENKTTRKPREISEGAAKNRNLRPLSSLSTAAAFEFAAAELKHYKEYLQKVSEYEKKYNIRQDADDIFNICNVVVFKEAYDRKFAHALKRWEQYKKAHECKLSELKKNAERAQKEVGSYTASHVTELAKREIIKELQRLAKIANEAEAKLQEEQSKVFLTESDILKMYNL